MADLEIQTAKVIVSNGDVQIDAYLASPLGEGKTLNC